MAARPLPPYLMKIITGVLIAATVLFAPGCAKTDWIDRTLVTVDVTGTWYGRLGGPAIGISPDLRLELAQQGSTVKGSLLARVTGIGDISGPITGTVGGDVFRFRDTRGSVAGE